jgi:hypothetical protein
MAMKAADRDQSERVQRVRAGVTGLAAVLVIAGLAGAIFNSASEERPVGPTGTTDAEAVATITGNTATAIETNEPLAELGVAPATINESAVAKPQ